MNIRIIRMIVLGLSLISIAAAAVWAAADRDSPLSVTINMSKPQFGEDEDVDGEVVITNSSSVSFPATFDIKFFQNDVLVHELSTHIETFLPGDNKYAFEELGIPQIHDDPNPAGHWRLVIIQKDVDESYAANVDFIVGGDSMDDGDEP